MKSITVLKIATALDPRYKNLKYLSDMKSKETWSLIKQQIANYDLLKTNVYNYTNSVNNIVSELNEKNF